MMEVTDDRRNGQVYEEAHQHKRIHHVDAEPPTEFGCPFILECWAMKKIRHPILIGERHEKRIISSSLILNDCLGLTGPLLLSRG